MNPIRNEGMETLLLCGEGKSSHAVFGRAKALLPLNNRPLFTYPLEAIAHTPRLGKIYVIGDKAKLTEAIETHLPSLPKEVEVLEQKKNIAANIWSSHIHSLGPAYREGDEKSDRSLRRKANLYLGGDSPLLTTAEVEEFLDAADSESYDYIVGLTPTERLDRYAPTADGKPGIVMAPFLTAQGLFRLNNLHIGRPFSFRNKGCVQKIYDLRYQKSFANAVGLLKAIWEIRHVRGRAMHLIRAQAALYFRNRGMHALSEWLRRRTSIDEMFIGIGDIIGLNAGYAITTLGGAAVDVDNEPDYTTLVKRFDEWRDGLLKEGS